MATGSGDHTVRLWDVAARTCFATLTDHREIVREVAFSERRHSRQCERRQNHPAMGRGYPQCTAVLTNGFTPVFCVAFSPDGPVSRAVAPTAGSSSGMRHPVCTPTLTGHAEAVASVSFSPDGNTVASGSHDRTVRLWHLRNAAGRVLKMAQENAARSASAESRT